MASSNYFIKYDSRKNGMVFTGPNDRSNDEPRKKKKRIIDKDEEGDFTHNGRYMDELGQGADYYAVFDTLWTLLSNGGFASYTDIGKELKRRLPKTKSFSSSEMSKFIADRLGEHNGFLRYAKIPARVLGGKRLIETVRGKGIQFNNAKGG